MELKAWRIISKIFLARGEGTNLGPVGSGSTQFKSGKPSNKTMKIRSFSIAVGVSFAMAIFAYSASVSLVGIDEDTNDAWRTTDLAKPLDANGDNIYGTDGYLIGSFGDASDQVDPSYAIVSILTLGPEIAEPHQAKFDDVNLTGPGPVPEVITGDYWVGGSPTGTLDDFFTIELTQAGTYRVGVIGDQTPDNPPGLFWEASRGIGIKGPGGVDTGSIDITGPGESWRDADVDYVLFDITGDVGDVFTVYGENDGRWAANALGGVFFDTIPEPGVPILAALGWVGLILRRRR